MSSHPIELLQSSLGETPEALNAIDVTAASSELVGAMIHPKMFSITHINQTVITAPTVAMDGYLRCHPTTNNGLQPGFFAIWHDLGVNLASALKQAKNRGLKKQGS